MPLALLARGSLIRDDNITSEPPDFAFCSAGIFTARKRSLRRLCFHRCLVCPREGACMAGGGWCAWHTPPSRQILRDTVTERAVASYWNAFLCLHLQRNKLEEYFTENRSQCLLIWQNVITGRNEVVAKVMFLQASVILSTGGVSASVHVGIPPHPPPQGEDTPWGQTPPKSRHLPVADTPQEQTPAPLGSRLRHTVNERPVRILLECILV